jgi:tetratricopeptide (TPR) repeat protein
MADLTDDTTALAAVVRSIADELPTALAGSAVAERLRAEALAAPPAGVSACAQWLVQLGYYGQAETIFEALKRIYVAMPVGLVGLAEVAMQRREWNTSLRRWDDVLEAFPTQPDGQWLTQRARVLYELGRREEAVTILQALATDFDRGPHGCIGLAQLAMRRHRWGEALAPVGRCACKRYPRHDGLALSMTPRAPTCCRCWVAMRRRRPRCARVIQADPWMIDAYAVLLRVLAATGRHAEAVQTLQEQHFRRRRHPGAVPPAHGDPAAMAPARRGACAIRAVPAKCSVDPENDRRAARRGSDALRRMAAHADLARHAAAARRLSDGE